MAKQIGIGRKVIVVVIVENHYELAIWQGAHLISNVVRKPGVASAFEQAKKWSQRYGYKVVPAGMPYDNLFLTLNTVIL